MKKIVLALLFGCLMLSAAEIKNLQAAYSSGLVKIQWQSNSEANLKHYVIEKSADGVNFTFLTLESPKGNGSDYLILDRTLYGKSYLHYRVKMVDSNNSSVTSETVKANILHSGISATWGSIKAMFR